jgi:anti-sigma factor RsiW
VIAARARPRYGFAAGWLAVGIALGWFAAHALTLPAPRSASLPRQAAIAHAVYAPEVRHPVEVGADQHEHLVRWLSKRLGTDLKAPVLTREGYELVGGRLLPGDTGAVAQFMYQDGQGRRLTLYVSRVAKDGGDTAFRYSRENEVSVFYWIDGTVAYALSGAMSRENLLAVATSVYKQLNP